MFNSLHIAEAWTVFRAMNLPGQPSPYVKSVPTSSTWPPDCLTTSFLQCHQYAFPSLVSQSRPVHCAPTVTHTHSRAVHSGLGWQPTLVWQAVLDFCSAGLVTCFLLGQRLLSCFRFVGSRIRLFHLASHGVPSAAEMKL